MGDYLCSSGICAAFTFEHYRSLSLTGYLILRVCRFVRRLSVASKSAIQGKRDEKQRKEALDPALTPTSGGSMAEAISDYH